MNKSRGRVSAISVAVLLSLGCACFGATYDWTGSADLNWNNPSNWRVTGSIYSWTWPNDEFETRRVNQDCDEINIANGDAVTRLGELVIRGATDGSNEAVLTIDKSSDLSGLSNMWIGRDMNRGRVEVRNRSSLSMSGNLSIAYNSAVGALSIVDGALHVGGNVNVGQSGNGTCSIKNSVVEVGSWVYLGSSPDALGELYVQNGTLRILQHLSVGHGGNGTMEVQGGLVELGAGKLLMVGRHGSGVGTLVLRSGTVSAPNVWIGLLGQTIGTVEIKGGTLNISGRLTVARECVSAAMRISAGQVNVGSDFQMNFIEPGGVSYGSGELRMDGGVVNVTGVSYLNYGGGLDSQAIFTLNGGTWKSGGDIRLGWTPNGGSVCLTINGGTMVSGGTIVVGMPGAGESRIFLNGGLLQGEDLLIDSLIVYRGGELRINKSFVGEAAMQALITAGKINVPAQYQITTIDNYTVLRRSGI